MYKDMKKKIGIVGLGLIGASFAKATKAYTEHIIYGLDLDVNIQVKAIKDGSIDEVMTEENIEELDLLLLAVRPGAASKFVRKNPNIKGVLIDLCGVKETVSKVILPISKNQGFQYIGGHPMAGKAVGGYENSSPQLYQDASMILVPHGKEIPSWIDEYFKHIGFGGIKISDDETHDRIIAFTSQLTHIVSNAYVKSETALEHFGYSADSLKDLTRVATLDEEMWTELFMENKKNLSYELGLLINELNKYKEAIDKGQDEELEKLLKRGKEAKATIYP